MHTKTAVKTTKYRGSVRRILRHSVRKRGGRRTLSPARS